PCRFFTPLPLTRKVVPDCVPAGILIVALPSSVGTSISEPSAAWAKLTGTSHSKSSPSRWKISCVLMCSTTYKSPGDPPRKPASPLPDERRREPASTPGGMRSLIFELRSRRPSPWQDLHGFSKMRPAPLQCGHVCAMLKMPREVMTCPRPPQVVQVRIFEPCSMPEPLHVSHRSSLETEISFSHPSAASSRLISRS